MSKKTYTLPQGISAEISNTVDLVKNNIGTLNYKIVPIEAIEFDPENPRELSIQRVDLPQGPKEDDPLFAKKSREFESLQQTAESIKKYGVRNAVEIYKYGTKYRLIHGERRCLSSIIAGKKDIPAKILDEKPNNFDIRLLQLIENIQREDLNLYETVSNIKKIIHEYKREISKDVNVDSIFLEGLINRSRSHCFNYLAVLNAPEDIQAAIKAGKIKSLEKAALIANVATPDKRQLLLSSCLNGASLKQLKSESKILKHLARDVPIVQFGRKKPGKKIEKIHMGATKNRKIINKLVTLVSKDNNYTSFMSHFNQMKFDSIEDCASSFNNLIKIMDKIES